MENSTEKDKKKKQKKKPKMKLKTQQRKCKWTLSTMHLQLFTMYNNISVKIMQCNDSVF